MNDVSSLLVGIDFGSSTLTGALAKKNPNGQFELIGIKRVHGYSGIRKGVIHNIEAATLGVKSLLSQLISELDSEVEVVKVMVGKNGYSIRSVDARSTLPLSGDEQLSDLHLDQLNDEARSDLPEGLEVMDVYPQIFLLDGIQDTNPVGTMPKQVEARYKIIVGQLFIQRNLEAALLPLKIEPEPVLGPIASAEAVMTPDEKTKGVVVVDFGAQTTSVTVVKGNVIRYVGVLPFGGDNITKDLESLNLDYNDAEKYKIESGSALLLAEQSQTEDSEAETDKISKFDIDANEVIVARAEEIVENIYAQIRYAGIEPQKLTEGVVITGGASQLKGLESLLAEKTGLSVRKRDLRQNTAIMIPDDISVTEGDALCLGLILLGQPNCIIAKVASIEQPDQTGSVVEPKLDGFEKVNPVTPVKPVKIKTTNKDNQTSKGKVFSDIFKKLFEDEDM